jgi:hypothetical protein
VYNHDNTIAVIVVPKSTIRSRMLTYASCNVYVSIELTLTQYLKYYEP